MGIFNLYIFILLFYLTIFYKIPKIKCVHTPQRPQRYTASEHSKFIQKVSNLTGPLLRNLDKEFALCGSSRIDIREITIDQVQKYFQTGELTSVILTSCYLDRIAKIDRILKSVVQVNNDAIKIASIMDLERRMGKTRGPLHGIPILVKDNIDTIDTTQTTTGAIALELVLPKRDAEVVWRLKNAGVVIIGKSNPSEWAHWRDSNIPNGWSGRGGQTLSPYVLNSSPGGSSTGSGVAIAANLAVVALGTETFGSIITPASRNSLVGIKTTINSVSTKGVIPIGFSQDVVGPMTRTVSDSAILLSVISNVNLQGCEKSLKSCLSQQNFRIGVVREPFWNASDASVKKMLPDLELSLNLLKQNHQVTIVDPVHGNPTLLQGVSNDARALVFRHEFKYGVNKYLERDVDHFEITLGRQIRSLADVIKFNIEHPSPEGYGQNILMASEATDGLNNQTYIRLRDQNRRNAQQYSLGILDGYNLDVLAAPCDPNKMRELYNVGDTAGYPSIAVPAGVTDEGIQFGICFTGRPNSEAILLKIAFLLESVHSRREMPTFLN